MTQEATVEGNGVKNLLLQSLSEEDFARIEPFLFRVDLGLGRVLTDIGEPIESVHFLETGIVTFAQVLDDGTRIGFAHVGYDGFAGWPVLLGCDSSPHQARITAIGGTALRISTKNLRAVCEASATLRDVLLRFVQTMFVQLGTTITSSLTQRVETRLCRWTLMAHDRVDSDQLFVTHEEISVMLGVRRATITDLLHTLEGEGLIRSERGKVVVLDRAGLLRHAGESYGAYEAEYSRLIAPFPRHAQ